MKRLRKIANDDQMYIQSIESQVKYGMVISSYTDQYDTNNGAYISYTDADGRAFFVFNRVDINDPLRINADDGDLKTHFEEAERKVIEELGDEVILTRNVISHFDFVDGSTYWENYEKTVQKSEKDVKQDDMTDNMEDNAYGTKTIQLQFNNDDIGTVRQFVEKGVSQDIIKSYSILEPDWSVSNNTAKYKLDRIIKALNLFRHKSNTRLKKIAYVYTNIMNEFDGEDKIKDFLANGPDIVSVFFTDDTKDINSSSASNFILQYSGGTYIAFGPNIETEIEKIIGGLGLQTYDDKIDMNTLLNEVSTGEFENIKTFNDYDSAETWVLANTNIKQRILGPDYSKVDQYINSQPWTDYYNTNLKQEDEQNEDKNEEKIMTLVMNYKDSSKAQHYINDWISKNMSILKPYNENLQSY